jgi:TonB family protein
LTEKAYALFMRAPADDAYSLEEIATAAGVSAASVRQAIRAGRVSVHGTHVPGSEAVALVRALRRGITTASARALPINVLPEPKRKQAGPLALSAVVHATFLLLMMVAASLGLLQAKDTDEAVIDKTPIRLVYLMQPGPGGGGGGGGLKMPAPPPKAERKAPAPKKKVSSPVPPRARRPTPPPPVPPRPTPTPPPPRPVVVPPAPVPTPTAQPPPPAPQAIVAPVASLAADTDDRAGLPNDTPNTSSSQGPGAGGGVGSGKGTGLGEGDGGGLGAGSGGGTGGGPYQPGSGVIAPELVREVRANYTDEARRRGVEGDVVLEIVVRRDGSVGNVRVVKSLGSGLEQKATDAVRQWRFKPATRSGSAVDVVVEVAVGFKLR